MVDGMIPHLVSFLFHSFHKIHIVPDVCLRHEKARRNIFLFEDVEHLPGISILIPAIKGEV